MLINTLEKLSRKPTSRSVGQEKKSHYRIQQNTGQELSTKPVEEYHET